MSHRSVSKRIVAIGDVHGDLPQLEAVLQMSNIVDRDGKWLPQSVPTVVVQLGDLVDRGPHDKAVMDFIMRLTKDATVASEGRDRVETLLGNHELMNLQGHFHYVHPESHEDFGGRHARKRAFAKDGTYGAFVRSMKLVHQEGESVFVHAGLMPSYAEQGVDALNRATRSELLGGEGDGRHRNSPWDDRHKLFGVHGPIWTRLLITDAMNDRCSNVHRSLELLGAKRMVVGHTPQRAGRIETYCDDALIAVDVGLSKWMYGNLAALEISEFTDGTTELREILPHTKVSSDHAEIHANEESIDSGEKDAIQQAVDDPMVLQELLELLQEKKIADAEKQQKTIDDERHEEL
eukprot:CAMPEP_0176405102 /NCGR_PEP_ID=MMETSP0127-20121128/159_1 /TAXON_ID=938130 /ORGANISM="Platyophrya macrostoma, Strain WH" /LENGTH=348 /DNA_ID=CAMNT_0017784139 /DNA_START=1494 /DNA_END=2540 /DNA_ORIENTATION=+